MIETVFVLGQLAVILGFGIFVTYSKHLHIAIAPLNVLFSRRPNGLGALQPMRSNGQVLDFEEADPDTDIFGLGKIEDLSWKGMLDLATCTECGRCQSQCPAWATGKPLSPKLLILELRDHAFAKAPYLLAGSDEAREGLSDAVKAEAERPLVGGSDVNGVIDPDVLWSCTNCGACVEECPVDIEHIDHISGMRRYQVLIESAFPTEAGSMLRNLENKGNPWGLNEDKRLEWISEVDFEVPVVDGKLGADVEYLFWVGCAGALEDRAKKTTKAIAELLHVAGVNFAVLGPAETCTGDPARRIGNEFVYSMLAQQNIETLNEAGARKIVASCPHCFNTIANEYPQLGGNYEVIHHTQLLASLLADGKIKPVHPVDEKITYHDPCFLGRHNRVFTAPREIMEQVPGVRAQEMHRCKERGFCCGAGGARMWMEERIGKRINTERIDEALGTDPDTISTGCPYCMVMLGDAVNAKKGDGEAKESLEVVDVAQLLIRSIDRPAAAPAEQPSPGPARSPARPQHGLTAGGGVQRRRVRRGHHRAGVQPARDRQPRPDRAPLPRAAGRLAQLPRLRRQLPDHRHHVDQPPRHVRRDHDGRPAAAHHQPDPADGRGGHPVPDRPGRRAAGGPGGRDRAGRHRRSQLGRAGGGGGLRRGHGRDLDRLLGDVAVHRQPSGPAGRRAAHGAAAGGEPSVQRGPVRLHRGHADRRVRLGPGRPDHLRAAGHLLHVRAPARPAGQHRAGRTARARPDGKTDG